MSIQHQTMVKAMSKDGAKIKEDLTAQDAELLHASIGISGEVGELLDAIKRATIYRKPIDMENVIEELGDIEFHMECIRQLLNISREQTLQANIQKLIKRYPSGMYSDEQAIKRADKEEM